MQIAPTTLFAPTMQQRPAVAAPNAMTMAPAEREVVLRPGDVVAAETIDTPAARLSRRYAITLLALPGVFSVSFRTDRPEVLRLNLRSERVAALMKGMLEPVIDDVRFELGYLSAAGRLVPYTGPAQGAAIEQVQILTALPGVWGHRYDETYPHEDARVHLRTIDQRVATMLDPLIRDQLDMGLRRDGSRRWMHVSWAPGVTTT